MLVHENTYRGWGVAAWIHRARLRTLLRLLRTLPLGPKGHLGDFGCSNGFILMELQRAVLAGGGWRFTGLDHSHDLLALAEAKGLPNTAFHHIDLNTPDDRFEGAFDLVTCLETLEHVGNLPQAVRTVLRAASPGGGIIVVGVPNETGLPGLAKFLARPLVQRAPYGDFFQGRSRREYARELLLHRRIEKWRGGGAVGWGPHLGFDYRWLDELLAQGDGRDGRYEVRAKVATPAGFNRLTVIERLA